MQTNSIFSPAYVASFNVTTFPATLTRHIAHDTDDTVAVQVECTISGNTAFDPEWTDAVVLADVRNEEGQVIYQAGEPLRAQNMEAVNFDEIAEAYAKAFPASAQMAA